MRLAGHAMGARFELVIPGEEGPALRAIGEEALGIVGEWHNRLSRFQSDSQLSHINRVAHVRGAQVDADIFALLTLCRTVHDGSAGAFDPTVARAIDGLIEDQPDLEVPGMACVCLDPAALRVRFTLPGVRLDLGGIAKGFALDRVHEFLVSRGVGAALVHGGTSSILGMGGPPGAEGWDVELRHGGVRWRVTLRDAHLSVSGASGRLLGQRGRGHILDPRDGRSPSPGAFAAVLGPCGAEAEGWSTALVVLGERPGRMPETLTSLLFDGERWCLQGPRASAFREAHGHHRRDEEAA